MSNIKAKRIIIDGAPGSGKTTILFGRTKDDSPNIKRDSLQGRGYTIFQETGPLVMEKVMKKGKPLDKKEIFDLITKAEIKKYKLMVKQKKTCFCDRSLLGFLPIATIHSNQELPEMFYTHARKMKYDDPVILLEPISTLDLSKPIQGHNIRRIFSIEERKQIHNNLLAIYKLMGYKVIVIPESPNGSKDAEQNIQARLELILKESRKK